MAENTEVKTEAVDNLPALRDSDVKAFVEQFNTVPGDLLFNALVTIYNYGVRMEKGDVEGARQLVYDNREAMGVIWRRCKEYEKAVKQLKPIIEVIAAAVPMSDVFKWQAGSKKTKKEILPSAMFELWQRLEKTGVSLESFLTCCKIDFKSAVELAGLSETKFIEEFAGDLCNIETVQNKSVLKGL